MARLDVDVGSVLKRCAVNTESLSGRRTPEPASVQARSAIKKVRAEVAIFSGNSSFQQRGAGGGEVGGDGKARLRRVSFITPRSQLVYRGKVFSWPVEEPLTTSFARETGVF